MTGYDPNRDVAALGDALLAGHREDEALMGLAGDRLVEMVGATGAVDIDFGRLLDAAAGLLEKVAALAVAEVPPVDVPALTARAVRELEGV